MTTITTPDTGHGGHHEGSYLTPNKGGVFATIIQWATTIDHKKIGMMYLFAVLGMFMLGGVAALMVRAELWEPTRTIVDSAGEVAVTGQLFKGGETAAENYLTYNRIFTMHGAVMVFLVIVPGAPATLGNFLLPLMLGAKDVAFPRLNLLSWYIYLLGAAFAVLALLNTGADTGWTFYTPYSSSHAGNTYGNIVMIRGKAPPFRGLDRTRFGDEQLRYWSVCQNELATQRYVACVADHQAHPDADGYSTMVVSDVADRPPNAIAANHIDWMPWGPYPDAILLYRNMLPDADFGQAVHHVPQGTPPEQIMGEYTPVGAYCQPDIFENAGHSAAEIFAACRRYTEGLGGLMLPGAQSRAGQ